MAVGGVCLDAYRHAGQLDDDDTHGYSRILINARRRFERAVLLVAEREESVVGSVTMCPPGSSFRQMARGDEMEFRFLAVAPGAWGTGVGDALVDACETFARDERAKRTVIGVRDTNEAAIAMYLRRDFTRLPERDWRPAPGVLLLGFQRTHP